jgi:hypothetical protein
MRPVQGVTTFLRGRRRRVAVVLFAVAAAGLVGAPAGASPNTAAAEAGHQASVDAAAKSKGGKLPPFTLAGISGAASSSQVAHSERSKLVIRSPSVLAGLLEFIGQYPNNYIQMPDPFYQPPCARPDGSNGQQDFFFQSWFFALHELHPTKSKPNPYPDPNRAAPYGLFPDTPVSMLAFGSIPVTATLHLQQPVDREGVVTPLRVYTWQPISGVPPECDPSYLPTILIHSLVVGSLNASLSNVEVDGQRVNVGTSCRSVTPLKVSLWGLPAQEGQLDYTVGGGGLLGQYDGAHVGSLKGIRLPKLPALGASTGLTFPIPKSTGITIPHFTGCGTGGDNLDPLINASVSGPDNPLKALQGPATASGLDLSNPVKCDLHCPTAPPFPLPHR